MEDISIMFKKAIVHVKMVVVRVLSVKDLD